MLHCGFLWFMLTAALPMPFTAPTLQGWLVTRRQPATGTTITTMITVTTRLVRPVVPV